MTEHVAVSNTGPTLPHLFKWIKHRASKKENKNCKKTDGDVDITTITTTAAISADAKNKNNKSFYKKSALLSKSSDNIHRIQTDISLSDHAKVLSNCTEFNSLQKSSPAAVRLKSESMVMFTTTATPIGSYVGDVICRHGAVQRTCRACMQLPALPPGHERVLRDLQRQEKKRIRESKTEQKQQQQQLSDTAPNLIQCVQPSIRRLRSPLENCSSPEHIYEEIPSHFFKERLQAAAARAADKTTHRLHVTDPAYTHAYNHRENSGYNHTIKDISTKHTTVIEKPQHNQNLATNNNTAADFNAKSTQPEDCRSNSRQVSLGNLDFGMAKECDGFLVVPLRDKSRTSPVTQQSYWQESLAQNQNNVTTITDSTSRHCTSASASHSVLPDHKQHAEHSVNNNVTSLAVTSLSTSHAMSHAASHSTSHGTSRNTSDSGYQDHSAELTAQHPDTERSDVTRNERHNHSETKGYSHCKRCKRPHGLYHGVSLCHSDVEDLRQELQYLDIAGLDKHKLRNADDNQSSPSLLNDITERRSAFSKYVPKHKHNGHNSTHSLYNQVSFNSGSVVNGITTSGSNSDAYKRQSMSTESDYFSSNYNTSQSDTTSRGSRDYHVTHVDGLHPGSRSNYVSTSEKSNDTFSEYDIHDIDSTQLEYEYYLAKARHHNMLKNNVKRIIFSSESEKSDVERGMSSDGAIIQDDTISLTSVTSLNSEISNLPSEDAIMDRLSCRVHRTARLNHTRTSARVTAHTVDTAINDKTPSPVEGIKPQTRTRKPIRKKRKSNKMEYYKLPNFSTEAQINMAAAKDKSSDTASVSSQSSGKRDYMRFERDFPEEHILDGGEKLSCRVTDFKLSDIRGKPIDARSTSHHASVMCDVDQSRTSLYSNHGQINRNSSNRLLSDLMRMNHDRQLFSLI